MDTSDFNFIFLGQSVLKYQVPLDVYNIINHIYETKYPELKPANKQLVGKIEKEHSLFFNGEDSPKMTKHNHLPNNVLGWFEQKFRHYLEWNKIKEYQLHFNSVWVNTMFENEYNPVHVHQGTLFTGLSSVMILKLPESYGVEYSSPDQPQNGRLQILGSANGHFANVDYQPNIQERDFFIFPYDMRHYLEWNKVKQYDLHFNSVWVNTMFENEYNPVHVHQGTLFTGLSSVMILKLPESYGVEYSAADSPQNGRLQILGSASGMFANVDYQPEIKERDFFVFPYDMRHCVYPFNGPGMRRTLAANMDVEYNPIKNRGVS